MIGGYDWAGFDVNTQTPSLSRAGLVDFIGHSYLARDEADARLVRAAVGRENERVCHGKGSSAEDFFFVYTTLFEHPHIKVPFTNFQMGVLRALNFAPSQLHPNAWANVQAFVMMFLAAGVPPTVPAFLHYFDVRPSPKGVGFR